MAEALPPAVLFLLGAALVALLPGGRLRSAVAVILPLLAAWQIWTLPEGRLFPATLLGYQLELLRIDRLSRLFGLVFAVAAALGNLYAWHLRDRVQQAAALVYAGSAVGAVLAGDLVSLFLWWEGTAIASVFLIWARGTVGAYHTGLRYLVVQVGSGVLLLAGIVLLGRETGSLAFQRMEPGSLATWLILLAFGVKAAFPLLNGWLPDAYPAATPTGAVILSIFTTKMAIYALARGFAGAEILIPVGLVMALVPALYALVENDLRRVLSHSLNSQLGFMVVGIGIGTELALNGAVSHAVASILYKGLLFMAVGAVLLRTGTARAGDLGGLVRTMPQTALLSLVGAASIASVPLFSGFVTKAMITGAAAEEGLLVVWLGLLLAAVAAVAHTAVRVPGSMFFGPDSGLRPAEAPGHMRLAMALAAALSIGIGAWPEPLFGLLPFPVDYKPYTFGHVLGQLQLVLFALLAVALLARAGLFPRGRRGIILDIDWLWRRAAPGLLGGLGRGIGALQGRATALAAAWWARTIRWLYHSHGPEGRIARVWPTGAMVLWLAILLGVTLVVNFVS